MLARFSKRLTATSLSAAFMLAVAGVANGQELKGSPAALAAPVEASSPAPRQLPSSSAAPANSAATSAKTAATGAAGTGAQEDLRSRIDRLEKQNQDLLEALKKLQNSLPAVPPGVGAVSTANSEAVDSPAARDQVQRLVSEYLKAADDKKAAADPGKTADGSYIVGKNLGLTGAWTNNQYWLESADKAYRVHVGGRIQPDFIFGANVDKNVAEGKGGTGPFLEGSNFRRARLEMDGWMHENIDFFVEFDWANTPFNTGVNPPNFPQGLTTAGTRTNTQPFNNITNVPAPTDVWAAVNYLPVIGSIRMGNLKPAIGLDHLTSSRYLDFLERSIGFDTYFNRNNGFEPGFMFYNATENKRATYQATITRTCNGPLGFSQGGGGWDYTGRLTWLPWYEDNGRRMIHLGLAAKYQGLDRSTGTGVANFNDRWLLRNSQSGFQNVVSFVQLKGDHTDQYMVNPEFFMNLGPLSIQAEYLGSQVNGVTSFNNQLNTNDATSTKLPTRTTFNSNTFYVQAMYFLTGENRPYGQTALHGSGAAPTRVVPYRNFFYVPGVKGCANPFSCGAWQVGARYCHSTLNDGPINGGEVDEVTLGLNWFLNPNLRYQWNYDFGHRSLLGGTSDGNYSGFGMRMCFDF